MTENLRIRSANPADADELLAIRRDAIMALAEEYGRGAAERWATAAHPDRAARAIATHSVWVTEFGSKVVGWVEVSGATIESLYVSPAAARLGVGSSLLAHAERQIREAGASIAYLDASPNAETFYARRGYRRAGEVKANNSIPMSKRLEASGQGGRWPPRVEELAARIRDAIREAAGSALAGLYLSGSLVVGDFDVDVSDIDLIAVLTSDPSDDLVVRLGRMHDALASENPVWADRIEVIYVSAAALSRWWEGIARMAVISPGEPFHVVEGGPDWVLTWYPARESTITLFGPPVETFIPPISREAFESAVRQHLRAFPSRVGDGASLPGQAYAILTMCRGWYTLCVGGQPSKVAAAAWAQREFPEWAPLIRSALAWRRGGASAGDSGASEVQRFVAEIARRVDGWTRSAVNPAGRPKA